MTLQGTISEQKQLFIQLKKQYLSRGIAPSEKLKSIAQDGGIEMSVLKGALDKVNRDLKQHSRRVYSRQMTEHVVEQIDNYYWSSGARDDDSETTDNTADILKDSNTLYEGDDLTNDKNISKLPTRWDTSADRLPSPYDDDPEVDQDTYLTAVTRLQSLSARRLTLQQKLNTYRTLLSLLEPYRKPKENVQPNLVWKESALVPELSTTRTLAIRVAGRVAERFGDVQVPSTAEDEDEDTDVDMRDDGGKAKVQRVLDSW